MTYHLSLDSDPIGVKAKENRHQSRNPNWEIFPNWKQRKKSIAGFYKDKLMERVTWTVSIKDKILFWLAFEKLLGVYKNNEHIDREESYHSKAWAEENHWVSIQNNARILG